MGEWIRRYSRGEPGYSAKLDRDHDGVACELKNAPKGAFKAKQATTAQTNTSSATTSGLSRMVLGTILMEMEIQ